MDSDGFVLVKTSKKKKKKYSKVYSCEQNICHTEDNNCENELVNDLQVINLAEKYCDNLKLLEKEFIQSEFFTKFGDILKDHNLLCTLNSFSEGKQLTISPIVSKIVCLGLGNFSNCKQSQYQLVFLR